MLVDSSRPFPPADDAVQRRLGCNTSPGDYSRSHPIQRRSVPGALTGKAPDTRTLVGSLTHRLRPAEYAATRRIHAAVLLTLPSESACRHCPAAVLPFYP